MVTNSDVVVVTMLKLIACATAGCMMWANRSAGTTRSSSAITGTTRKASSGRLNSTRIIVRRSAHARGWEAGEEMDSDNDAPAILCGKWSFIRRGYGPVTGM